MRLTAVTPVAFLDQKLAEISQVRARSYFGLEVVVTDQQRYLCGLILRGELVIGMKRIDQQIKLAKLKVVAFSALFALVASLASPLPALATERTVDCLTNGQPSGSFTVAQLGDEITVTNATSCSGSIVIPGDVTFIGIAFQNNTNINSIEIGSGVTRIGTHAFANSSNLRTVTFAANSRLTEIPEYAFDGADVRSIIIPPTVTVISEGAFTRNSNLESVTFEAGSQVRQINRMAFFRTNLTSISIPSTVTSIGNEAFRYNRRLASITFAENSQLNSIGEYAFEEALQSVVTLPANLRTVNRLTFGANIRLSVPTNHQYFSLENGVLFNANKTELVSYPGWKTGDSYDIPSTVTRIAPFAFETTRLISVNIPASVSTVGDYAFYRSSSLATATIAAGSNIGTFGYGVFNGTSVTSLNWPTTLTRSGFRFLGWSNTDGGSLINNPAASALADQRVFAVWQSLTHTVTFDSNSGSAVSAGTFIEGASIDAPVAPTRDGFTFTGWSATSGGSAITFPYSPSEAVDITLFALWTEGVTPTPVSVSVGSSPASRVASIPAGNTAASIPATAELPSVSLNFAAAGSSATVTVAPIANPAASSATPFAITSSTKIVDIQVAGVTGPVTVCLDGSATNKVFHFTGGAWETLSQLTFVNGQVCGVTESFSPFAAADVAHQSPYSGPLISGRTPKVVSTGGGAEVTITGQRLASVSSVILEGNGLAILSKSDDQIVVKVPSHAPGFADLLLKSDSVSMTFQDALEYRSPVVVRVQVTKTKTITVGSAKSLSASQRKSVNSFAGSAVAGAVLTCSATYASKVDAATAKNLALAACANAKKANANLVTYLGSLVRVQPKLARKVILSLTN